MHFLYLSNGNFVSQKEQIKLVGAELPGGVGGGVDLDAVSSVIAVLFSSGCVEVFIIGVYVYVLLVFIRLDFLLKLEYSEQKNTMPWND